MKKRYIFFLFVIIIVFCSFLFNSFYNQAKQEAIKNLNNEQLLHARHAARGIEDFFNYWMSILTALSESTPVVNMEETAKKNIELLYNANRGKINAITRVDAEGRIVYTFPLNPDAIGRNISLQGHVREIMRTHKPVISDVFFAVQGYDTVAVHVPVFRNKIYQGTIAVTINFQSLSKRYLEDIKIGKTGYAWMTSREGIELYCPVPRHTGKSILETSKDSASKLAMVKDMLRGHQGSAIYTEDKISGDKVDLGKRHAVFMPIKLGETFWSVVVCSSEDEIIASLENFRNKLILVIGLLLLIWVIFSYYGLKSWFIIQEEEKRRRVEEALKQSEEKHRILFECSHDAIMTLAPPSWRFTAGNPATVEMFEANDLAAFTALRTSELSPDSQPDGFPSSEKAAEMIQTAMEKGSHFFEWTYRRLGGELFPATVLLTRMNIAGQDLLQATVRDITERKRASDEMAILADIGRVIGATLEIDKVYERVAAEIGKLIIFDNLVVNLFNAQQETLNVAYVSGLDIPGRRVGESYPVRGTVWDESFRTKKGMIVQLDNPEYFTEKFPSLIVSFRAGILSVMSIPLITHNEVIGNLIMRSKKSVAYTEQDLRLAEKIGMEIAGAIANARLFSERKKVEEELQQSLETLRKAVGTTIQVMASAVEARDPYTAGHQIRSADLARTIAVEMGLPQDKIEGIRIAGSIHDIGKLSIPAEILSKPTKLSEIEFSLIKEHARKGYEMLRDVESPWPLAEIVFQHHERMDGSGYPRNLKGDDILIEARILCVADVVEAMASHRPYRPGLGIDAALNEIEKNKGVYYDNAVAGACLRLFREKHFKLAEA
jgi:HD-GYP domain-containing protein (c-di-GMP phosphodiesterase class II)/PAS domain-containing protein